MSDYATHPELAELPGLIKKQRQHVAAQIAITERDKAVRRQMRALLDAVGQECVECDGYVVRRATSRDGEPIAKVEKMP